MRTYSSFRVTGSAPMRGIGSGPGPTAGRGHTGPITGFPGPFRNYLLTIAGCRPDTGGYPRRSSKEVGQDGNVTGTGTETANGGRAGTEDPRKDVMKGAGVSREGRMKDGMKDPGVSKEDPVRTAVGAQGRTIATAAETNRWRHDHTHDPSGAEEVRMKKQGKSLVVAVIVSALIAGLSCCQKEEGQAERAGKKIEKAMEKAGKQIEKAGKKIEHATKDAHNK
jgi:hypothetical protein